MPVPSNLNQYGDTTIIFGLVNVAALKAAIGDILLVESAKYDEKPEVNEIAEGEVGEAVSRALQKPERWMQTMTIDGMVKDIAAYRALAEFNFESRLWIVPERSRSEASKQWARVTVTAETYINITS